MKEYHKIKTVYLRDPETKHRTLLEGQFAIPEFEYLQAAAWYFTEKVDGTNIRVGWNGSKMEIGGRTDNAQIPAFLFKHIQEKIIPEVLGTVFGREDDTDVVLFGEGYGARIQKGGGNYIPDGVGFILFDVNIGGVWLERGNIEDISSRLSLRVVPILFRGMLTDAVAIVREGIPSRVAQVFGTRAEGLVMRPKCELMTRRGSRIISKIKHKDFLNS